MKILKMPDPIKPYLITCTCGAELEAEPSDFKRVAGCDQRDRDSWDYIEVTLPCCKAYLRIDKGSLRADKMPPRFYSAVQSKSLSGY